MKKTIEEVINNSPIFNKNNLPMEYTDADYCTDVDDEDYLGDDSEEDVCSEAVIKEFKKGITDKSEDEITQDFRRAVLSVTSGMGKGDIITLPNGKKAYGTVVSEGFIDRRLMENDFLYAIEEIRKNGYLTIEELRIACEYDIVPEKSLYNIFARALRNALYYELSTRHCGQVHNLTTKVVTELTSVVDYLAFKFLFRPSFFSLIHSSRLKTASDVYRVMMSSCVTRGIIDYARTALKRSIETSSCAPIGDEEDGFTLEDTEAFAVEGRFEEELLTIATRNFLKIIASRTSFKPTSTAYRVFKAKSYFCLKYNVINLQAKELATLLGVTVQAIYEAQHKVDRLYEEFADYIGVTLRKSAS